MELLITIGAIFVLIILSAFFSGSETALTALSRARIYELERRGIPFFKLWESTPEGKVTSHVS